MKILFAYLGITVEDNIIKKELRQSMIIEEEEVSYVERKVYIYIFCRESNFNQISNIYSSFILLINI